MRVAVKTLDPSIFALFDVVASPLLWVEQGLVCRANAAAERLFGAPRGALYGRTLTDLFAPESRAAVLHALNGATTATGYALRPHLPPTAVEISSSVYENRAHVLTLTEQKISDEDRLRTALNKEHELNELKTRMMVRIAHEFRTPLSRIATASHLLHYHRDMMTAEAVTDRFGQIERQVQYVSRLLDNIAFVVNGQFDQLYFTPLKTDVDRVCREMIEECRALIGGEHHFEYHADGQLASVTSDRMLVQLIVGNLLTNAVKFSPPGSTVRVSADLEGSDIVIRIADEGIGIPEHDRTHLFTPFYRGTNFDERPGLGLGLSIVREAVAIHQGSISVESEVGQGTTFSVRLPTVINGPR
jgi:signal transduction histidine kinase